jgi:hypothetical protein
MATAIRSARSDEIKLETNVPQTFALKYSTGKPVGEWGNIMFTAIDGRRLFLNTEDASEFEHALLDLRIQPADFITVTRVKHGGRGGGFSIRVERVPDESEARQPPEPPAARRPPARSTTEALLEKSVEMARAAGPAAFTTPAPSVQAEITPAAVRLCSTMCILIDSMTEAKAYAQRRGIDLTNEDLRCLVTTAYMSDCKGGGR